MAPLAVATWRERRMMIGAASLAGLVFIVDVNVPFDVAICALYGVVVLFGLFMRDPRFPWVTACLVTVLTVVGGWLSPPGGPVEYGIANRVLTLA